MCVIHIIYRKLYSFFTIFISSSVRYGYSPLHIASKNGYEEMVKELLKYLRSLQLIFISDLLSFSFTKFQSPSLHALRSFSSSNILSFSFFLYSFVFTIIFKFIYIFTLHPLGDNHAPRLEDRNNLLRRKIQTTND